MTLQKRALICGISGQDGAYLAQLLLQKDYEVIGTSRDCQLNSFRNLDLLGIRNDIKFASMALNDFRSVLQVLAHFKPAEIYNLAGQSSVSLSFEQPAETLESIALGTLNLLEAISFLDKAMRIYSAGSSECFGDTGGKAANETWPFYPSSPYAVAKSTAFWQVVNYREAYGLHASTGVLFNHESPLRPERFVTQKIIAAAKRIANGSKEKLTLGNLEVSRDWGWAPDYVEAMWLMLQQDQADDYVIATGQSNTLKDFVGAAFAYHGLNWLDHTGSNPQFFRAKDPMFSRADPGRAQKRLGWTAKHKMADVVRLMSDAANA
jgi:GDPmannose 4,6-dehydratase